MDVKKLFSIIKLLFYGATGGGKEWRGECKLMMGVAESKQ